MLPETVRRAFPWILRAWWAALPFTAGPALADALAGAHPTVRTVASVGLWVGWAAGLGATLVPHPVALTALRVLGPAAVVAAVAAAAGEAASALAVAWTAVAAALALAPDTAMVCANGPAYPNERRFLLRAPGPLLLGPIELAWAIAVTGVVAGPLLLADRHWVLGAIATVVGLPTAALLLRSLHQLSKRWAVFVPAGLVLVDPIGLTDSVLILRRQLRSLGPAPATTRALDLTQRAPGLALEVALSETLEVTVARPGRGPVDATKTDAVLFTPTLPGALLEEARARRLA
ncbi:MAG: hypothetical protein JO265_07540 [Acidimicrobiia bacterium]|nr:hypothetical protein [Acidimicrobiia bacterium]